jgi:hypothetical protein
MSAGEDLSPRALAEAKLQESGLTASDARRLGMESLTPEQTKRLGEWAKPYPCLRIPYFTAAGKRTGFYRIRYLGGMAGFDALKNKGKGLRYVQPPDTDPELYLAPLADWRAIAANPALSLNVTEGEIKSACACKLWEPTIGLGGVWSWRSKKKALPFLKDLEGFAWEGRRVNMLFDSDFATNPDVMRALVAFSKELAARGAVPHLVSLPSLPELEEQGKKTGLDDFLVARGRKRLDALVEDAVPFSQSQELWRLNEEVVYIRDPGLVVTLADGRKMTPAAFKDHQYANRHYWESSTDAKGNSKFEKKPIAPAWLKWEQRAELARVTYRPGEPRIVDGQLNYWPGWGAEPRRGDVSLWRRLLDYVFQGDAAARQWFERWAAYPIQNPGEKMYSCAVLWGPTHGTGKSLIGYSIGACYGKNFKEIGDEDISGGFNEWAENRQFVMGDDVTGSEYKKDVMEKLKRMVTRRTLTVNAKYMPTYEVPDVISYLFTANHPDSFLLEDTDRRYFVWEMPPAPLERAFYEEYDRWLKGPDCAPALLHHFMTLDLGGFNPRAHAMETNAKRSMALDAKSDLGIWVHGLKEHPDDVLKMGGVALQCDLWSTAQLLGMYDPEGRKKVTANGMGRELKRAGFKQVCGGQTVRTQRGPLRLYAIRNAAQWVKAKHGTAAEHFDRHNGTGAPAAKKEKF